MTLKEAAVASKPTSFASAVASWDNAVSRAIYTHSGTASRASPARLLCFLLEFSGHGVPWIAFSLAFLLLPTPQTSAPGVFLDVAASPWYLTLIANLLLGLLTDLVWIVLLKMMVKRSRPVYNPGQQAGSVNLVDQYSFPSGHCTRTFFVATLVAHAAYLNYKEPSPLHSFPTPKVAVIAVCWATAIAWSRIALGRHFFLDVLAGILVGIANGCFVILCWISTSNVLLARTYWLQITDAVLSKLKH